MKVSLSKQFARDLHKLGQAFRWWDSRGRREIEIVYRKYGLLWQAGAKRRVPVDESRLEKGILAPPPYWDVVVLVQEVGTNVPYGPYIEFGTEKIAGGAVKAIGDDAFVTDTQAVHDWPAKRAEAIDRTSVSIDTAGGAVGRLRNASGQFLRAKPQEQMPWLRPAFAEIRESLTKDIDAAYEPPRQR